MTLESAVGATLRSAIRLLTLVLPRDQREWGDALVAELHAVATIRDGLSLALSGALGLVLVAAERLVVRWASAAVILLIAALLGLASGYIDAVSGNRWPLRGMIIASSIVMGIAGPNVAVVSGLLIGLGVPVVAVLTGFAGPYYYDHGDVWFPLLPAIACAVVTASVRRRASRGIA